MKTLLALLILLSTSAVQGQVGKLLDANTATEAQLTALPGMTTVMVKALMDARPFLTVVELNTFLGQKLTAEQLTAFYEKAFIHVNLNTGTVKEMLLIPGAGLRMASEFTKNRPWKTQAQFETEISKYVGMKEATRLWRYVVIE